jgi:hypothetical protein
VTAAVVRASSGATAYLSIASVVNLVRGMEADQSGRLLDHRPRRCRAPRDFRTFRASRRPRSWSAAKVEGSRPLVSRTCDFLVSIPVRGRVTSLNASAAAAIGLHELAMRLVRPLRTWRLLTPFQSSLCREVRTSSDSLKRIGRNSTCRPAGIDVNREGIVRSTDPGGERHA